MRVYLENNFIKECFFNLKISFYTFFICLFEVYFLRNLIKNIMTHQTNISSIYNEYVDHLYAYALHLGFDEDIAMDAIHDLFYKLCINHTSLENIANLKFYLFKSLKNRLVEILRTNKEYAGTLSANKDVYENMLFRFNINIEDKIIEDEDLEEIRKKVENILERLTDRQREIIYLRYIHEYDYNEIADLMQITVESCRNLISKSLRKLKVTALSQAQLLLIISFVYH